MTPKKKDTVDATTHTNGSGLIILLNERVRGHTTVTSVVSTHVNLRSMPQPAAVEESGPARWTTSFAVKSSNDVVTWNTAPSSPGGIAVVLVTFQLVFETTFGHVSVTALSEVVADNSLCQLDEGRTHVLVVVGVDDVPILITTRSVTRPRVGWQASPLCKLVDWLTSCCASVCGKPIVSLCLQVPSLNVNESQVPTEKHDVAHSNTVLALPFTRPAGASVVPPFADGNGVVEVSSGGVVAPAAKPASASTRNARASRQQRGAAIIYLGLSQKIKTCFPHG